MDPFRPGTYAGVPRKRQVKKEKKFRIPSATIRTGIAYAIALVCLVFSDIFSTLEYFSIAILSLAAFLCTLYSDVNSATMESDMEAAEKLVAEYHAEPAAFESHDELAALRDRIASRWRKNQILDAATTLITCGIPAYAMYKIWTLVQM